MLFIAFIGL